MKLRYGFDPGAGVCLWSIDAEAIEKFGYPVSLEYLPLSEETTELGHVLMCTFDSGIDWSNPGGAALWSLEQAQQFQADSAAFYGRLCAELGAGFALHTAPLE